MNPNEILQSIYERAAATLGTSVIEDEAISERIEFVCKCLANRSGVRLLMSCILGKLDNPAVDPRIPIRR